MANSWCTLTQLCLAFDEADGWQDMQDVWTFNSSVLWPQQKARIVQMHN